MSKKYTDVYTTSSPKTKPKAGKIATIIIIGLILLQLAIPTPSNSATVLASEAIPVIVKPTEPAAQDKQEVIAVIQTVPKPNPFFVDRVMVTPANKEDLILRTQAYIAKYFPTTSLTATQLVDLSLLNEFPLDFLLVNGHLESHMCTAGRGMTSNNCHNVNNTDRGDNMPITICGLYTECHKDVLVASQKFINLIKNCYTGTNQATSLQTFIDNDFRVQRTVQPFCSVKPGSRYMTDTKAKTKYINAISNFINPIFTGYAKN